MDIRKLHRPYEIRWARPEEWVPTMDMIWRTFLKYEGKIYSEEGVEHFFEFITSNELHDAFLRGEYRLMVARDGERIIGAGSVRDGNHLSLLFVEETYHGRGVGSAILRRLCGYLKTEAGECCMSLAAAPVAVDFYRKQGFRQMQPELEVSGIRVTPMKKSL